MRELVTHNFGALTALYRHRTRAEFSIVWGRPGAITESSLSAVRHAGE